MRTLIILILVTLVTEFRAQEIADFENFDLELDTFLNGSDLSGGFTSSNIFLPNSYNLDFMSWADWSISTMRDDSTAGFGNQFSAYAGTGAEDSEAYAVASAFQPVKIYMEEDGIDGLTNGIFISNSTYTALSMLNGDMFAKAFGGESGDDPDFLLLTIKGWFQGEPIADSVNFYLADYRFDDNSQDYIVKDWEYVDLTSLFAVDSLEFSLSSSDNGMFGMNTPAYFCVDNIDIMSAIIATENQLAFKSKIYPNPAENYIMVHSAWDQVDYHIYNIEGKLQQVGQLGNRKINIEALQSGVYFLRLQNEGKAFIERFVKK